MTLYIGRYKFDSAEYLVQEGIFFVYFYTKYYILNDK